MLVKICGMRHATSLEVAASLGADLCGFIFHPQSPRHLDPAAAGKLPSYTMLRTGVFVNQSEDEIREIAKVARLDLLQLHGSQSENCALSLGRERIIRVIWPERFKNVNGLNMYLHKMAPSSAFFLLEAGQKSGGSGHMLDLSLLKGLESPLPCFLAGGLSPQNVEACLRHAKVQGLDVNSGVESSPGVKDKNKMLAFFSILRAELKNGENQ